MTTTSVTYDHGKKAGNVGDVWKHSVLVSIAARLPAAPSFLYVESHCGAPLHQLRRPGEWEHGVQAALARGEDSKHAYLPAARPHVDDLQYPAGWWFFSSELARRVTHVSVRLYDVSQKVAMRYSPLPAHLCPDNVTATFTCSDGYTAVGRLQQADIVFLDPPYSPNADTDWQALAQACVKLRQREVPFLAWYPLYWPTRPQRLVDATAEVAWEVTWAPCGKKPSQNLKGCGVLVSRPLVPLIESARAELEHIATLIGGKIVLRAATAR